MEKKDLFHIKKEVIFAIFAHHERTLSAEEAHFHYFLLRTLNSPSKIKPCNLSEDFARFLKTLQILEKLGYLNQRNEGYCLGEKKILSLRRNRRLWNFFRALERAHIDKLPRSDYLRLCGLVLIKRRFPFLKAHELQIALERVFGLKEPYRRVEELSCLADRITSAIEDLTRYQTLRIRLPKQALA